MNAITHPVISNELKAPIKITLTYYAIGTAWILFGYYLSNHLNLFPFTETIAHFELYKGLFFILVTGFILFLLIRKNSNDLTQKVLELEEAQSIANVGSWELFMPGGKIKCSKEYARMFGFDPKNERPDFDFIFSKFHPEDRECILEAYKTSWESKKPFHIVHRIIGKNGEIYHIEENAEHFYNEQGHHIRTSGTCRDITREVNYLENIKQQNKLLKDLTWKQSHIFRAPIARILGLLDSHDILVGNEMDEQEFRNLLHQSAQELDDIVRGLTHEIKQK